MTVTFSRTYRKSEDRTLSRFSERGWKHSSVYRVIEIGRDSKTVLSLRRRILKALSLFEQDRLGERIANAHGLRGVEKLWKIRAIRWSVRYSNTRIELMDATTTCPLVLWSLKSSNVVSLHAEEIILLFCLFQINILKYTRGMSNYVSKMIKCNTQDVVIKIIMMPNTYINNNELDIMLQDHNKIR